MAKRTASYNEQLQLIEAMRERLIRESRRDLLRFTMSTMPTFNPGMFHRRYYQVLTDFAFGDIRKLAVFVPPQHGKLLPADTPILTTTGWKKHGDLTPGDYVFGQDGKPKRVLRNFGVYEWNVEKITFNSGESILAAREHLWKLNVDHDDGKGRVVEILETQDIFKRRNRRAPSIDIATALDMPVRELPIDPYVLGCWLGDGTSRCGALTCGAEDIDHFVKLGTPNEVKPNVYRIPIDGLSRKLRLAGLICNKHIPMDYILSSREQRMALLQGLMDTDGYVNTRGTCEFTQKEGQLAHDVELLLRTLGFKPNAHTYDEKLNGVCVGKKVRITFNPDRTDTIFRLPRKQARVTNKTTQDRGDKRRHFIKSISNHGVVLGNCIQVEGSMYLAGEKLIPTHNSEGSTRRLPAFLLGRNPDLRVAVVSYSAPKARKFNREIQRIIDTPEYNAIFPDTMLNGTNVTTVAGSWLRNADECEIVGHRGGFKTVGVGGALTGDPVDILIMDDIYKDAKTAWSPIVREAVADWYDSVAETRLHNDSQQLMVFTRWHEEDLGGRLLQQQGEYSPDNPDGWVVCLYPAIKEGAPTEYDPREEGEPLWAERHNLHSLEQIRKRNPHVFASLYQQNPKPSEGLMYSQGFRTYTIQPASQYAITKAYIDTADTGDDYLCGIIYSETETVNYIRDVLYTQKPMEYTEVEMARMLTKHHVTDCVVESNNGGRGFARNVERECRLLDNHFTKFTWFHQKDNKEVRIFINSAAVQNVTYMPEGWDRIHPQFYNAISGYLKSGKNEHDDAPDALTGTYERRKKKRRNNLTELFG